MMKNDAMETRQWHMKRRPAMDPDTDADTDTDTEADADAYADPANVSNFELQTNKNVQIFSNKMRERKKG